MRFLLGLVDRAKDRVRELEAAFRSFRNANPLPGETPGCSKNYAAEAAIKVKDLAFQQFLRWHPDAQPVGGASSAPPLSSSATGASSLAGTLDHYSRDPVDLATDRLRAILGIKTRKHLNTERDAAARWVRLKIEYGTYRDMSDAEREAAYPGHGSAMWEGDSSASRGAPAAAQPAAPAGPREGKPI